jgi:hypothetical protein
MLWLHRMVTHSQDEPSAHDPALAAARVIESATELLRAEAGLLVARAGAQLVKTLGAVLAGMVATSAAQVALILFALSPALLASRSRSSVLIALLPSLGLAFLGACAAVMAWRSLSSANAAHQGSK